MAKKYLFTPPQFVKEILDAGVNAAKEQDSNLLKGKFIGEIIDNFMEYASDDELARIESAYFKNRKTPSHVTSSILKKAWATPTITADVQQEKQPSNAAFACALLRYFSQPENGNIVQNYLHKQDSSLQRGVQHFLDGMGASVQEHPRPLSKEAARNSNTFPQEYDFESNKDVFAFIQRSSRSSGKIGSNGEVEKIAKSADIQGQCFIQENPATGGSFGSFIHLIRNENSIYFSRQKNRFHSLKDEEHGTFSFRTPPNQDTFIQSFKRVKSQTSVQEPATR